LIFVLPRLTDSLHPGNGGNPGFNAYDLDSKLRLVFYPAIVAWTLLGTWIATVRVRIRRLEREVEENRIND
jgi:heme exporter protein C